MLYDVMDQIRNRRSVRVFKKKPVESDIKEVILEAAFQAPTAGAMMLYTIIDIKDQDLKDKLAVACDNQPFIAKAPLVLIFLADYQRWYDTFCIAGCEPRKPSEGDLMLAYADAVIAAQNTVIAAESMGIGSCYIGDILENCETVRELLNLPDYSVPAAMLVYGYPTDAQMKRKKPARFDREYMVYENKYDRLTAEELLDMHRKRNIREGRKVEDIINYIQAFCSRKYMSDFSIEMSRSAVEYLKKFDFEKS